MGEVRGGVTRRSFLRGMVAMPLSLIAANMPNPASAQAPTWPKPPINPPELPGGEKDDGMEGVIRRRILESVLFLDMPGFDRAKLASMSGLEYNPNLYHDTDPAEFTINTLLAIPPEDLDMLSVEDRQQLLVAAVFSRWQGHAASVMKTFENRLPDRYKPESEGSIELVEITPFGEIGNANESPIGISFDFGVTAQRIVDAIRKSDQSRAINGRESSKSVNLSFQPGKGRAILITRESQALEQLESSRPVEINGINYYIPLGLQNSWKVDKLEFVDGVRRNVNILDVNTGERISVNIDDLWRQEQYDKAREDFRMEKGKPGLSEFTDVEIIEQYSPLLGEETQRENLLQLLSICKKFPDKMFFAAAGNENSDFYELRKQMEDAGIWPENLLIIGYVNEYPEGEYSTTNSGGDTYLNSKDTGIGFSSLATPYSHELFSILSEQNSSMSNLEIKQMILDKYTVNGEYTRKPLIIGGDDLVRFGEIHRVDGMEEEAESRQGRILDHEAVERLMKLIETYGIMGYNAIGDREPEVNLVA